MKNLRRATHAIALGALVACAKDKPAADTTSAKSPAASLPAPGVIKAAPLAVPDSVQLMKQADTKGAASKGVPSTTPPKAAAPVKTQSPVIIGRDSVRRGPIIALPAVADTAKRRPPG